MASTHSLPASAAAPPLPVVVTPDPVQARLQAQIAVQRAQAQMPSAPEPPAVPADPAAPPVGP
ncbi:MAG: hypothetical protein ACRETR_09005 [Steroidobacteraceae bacterium]